MRLSAVFQVPRVNFARYRAALQERMSEVLKQAAVQYLRATAEGKVPVWSGASRATFSALASHVDYALFIAQASGAPNRIDLGLAHGVGVFEIDATQGLFSFTYSTTLPHLIVNEYYNANTFINPKTGQPYFHLKTPGPYHFQEAGQDAFREATAQVELPGWEDIMDTTSIQVG
jgi:hypothetical protein